MKLEEFISQAILEIVNGIRNANTKQIKVGLYSPGKNDRRHIEFDVAVMITKSDKGSIGLSVPFLPIEGKISDEQIIATTNRVKFGVRIK